MDDRDPEKELAEELEAELSAEEALEVVHEPVETFRAWVESIPLLSPLEIDRELRERGYFGQEAAVRALSLAAHRHVRRLKAIHVDGIPRAALPAKQNLLLVGPTGCGKTYLVELLFRDILRIPTTIVDITAFSETGYIGQDTASIVTRLLFAAGGDLRKTQVGIVCLDEFDKLASSQNRAVFAGQGTTKDVSGIGVQRELLKMLEATSLPVPTELDHNTYQDRLLLDTADVAFVAAGAFSGLKAISEERGHRTGIGFHAAGRSHRPDEIAVRYDQEELEDTVTFQEYGFLPELIGRFSRIVPFHPLGRETLTEILHRSVVKHYELEFRLADIALEIAPAVLADVVDRALEKQTGARGLRSALIRYLEESAYEAYSRSGASRIVIDLRDGEIETRVE